MQAQSQEFAGRKIDIAKYVSSHKVVGYNLVPDVPGLYARVRNQGAVQIRFFDEAALMSDAPLDLMTGKHMYPGIDLSRRFATIGRRDPITGDDIIRADTANDEHYDLFVAQNGGRDMKRLTSSGRIQSFAAHGGRIAYVEQVGAREPYSRCMRLLNTRTRVTTTVACESSFSGFSPAVTWRPDGRAFVSSRRLFRIVGDSAVPGETIPSSATIGWRDTTAFRYIGLVDGVRNVLDYEFGASRTVPVTSFTTSRNLQPAVQAIDGRQVLFVIENGRTLLAFDMITSKQIGSASIPSGAVVNSMSGRFALLTIDFATVPQRSLLLRSRILGDSLVFDVKELPSNTDAPQTCNVVGVTYKSFDRDMHGLLYTPRNPLPDVKDRLGIVIAYYGGSSVYDYNTMLWCEAGITTLSANIDRNTNGDRGGDEIVDGIYGAKWLQQRLGVAERQIGTFGMSQGGFNALRLVTFQPETNKRDVAFDFGFSIAQAGYSSQLTILKHTNTESPFIIATGNPDTEQGRRKLMDRSPVNQIDRLKAPVLLIHGTHDYRVQIEESWQFLEAAKKAGKDVTLIELPGEGHGVSMEKNRLRYYQAQLSFLERVRRSLDMQP